MRSPDARTPLTSSLLAIELVALLLAATWAIVFHARMPGRIPTEADHTAAAAAVSAEFQRGDVVLLQPWWTERARLFMPPNVPVIGYLGSDTEALEDAPRIWVLSQPDLPKSGASDFFEQFSVDRARVGEPRRFGELELSLWKNGRYRPAVFNAAEQLSQARVYLESANGARADCPWNGRAHQCPQAQHLRAAAEWHEVNQVPRRCVYLHPPGGDNRIVAEWSNVQPGERLQLEGGIVWEHAAKAGDVSDVTVSAQVNGNPVLFMNIKAGVETFYRHEAPSPPGPFTLRLVAQAQNPAHRELCIGLFTRAGKAP